MANKKETDANNSFAKRVGDAVGRFTLDVMRHHVESVNREEGVQDMHGRVSEEALRRYNKQVFDQTKQDVNKKVNESAK